MDLRDHCRLRLVLAANEPGESRNRHAGIRRDPLPLVAEPREQAAKVGKTSRMEFAPEQSLEVEGVHGVTLSTCFNHARLIVMGSVVRVKRRVSAAMGCSAPLSSHFRAGAGARVAACGQAGGRRHESARRRARTAVDGRGYQMRRWLVPRYRSLTATRRLERAFMNHSSSSSLLSGGLIK